MKGRRNRRHERRPLFPVPLPAWRGSRSAMAGCRLRSLAPAIRLAQDGFRDRCALRPCRGMREGALKANPQVARVFLDTAVRRRPVSSCANPRRSSNAGGHRQWRGRCVLPR
jgi:hypothetical protein